jgi:hypothetical protein
MSVVIVPQNSQKLGVVRAGNDRHSNGLMIIDHRCEDGHFHVNMVIRCPRVA